METVQVTLLRKSLVSSSQSDCARYRHKGHAGSKTLLKIHQFLTWVQSDTGCQHPDIT